MTTVANHHESLLNWHFAATFFVPARQPLRFILRFESVVTYPDESEIKDPALTLHAAVASELAVHVDAAERRYRRFRQRFREDISIWHEEPGIVVDHAADVFRKLAALALRTTATDFKAFERAIEWDGGAAEIAFWYAHHLYKVVQHGRMPSAATRFITPGATKGKGNVGLKGHRARQAPDAPIGRCRIVSCTVRFWESTRADLSPSVQH